jgi:bifunctional NMN adenylyltransferase/nudix hydrolase
MSTQFDTLVLIGRFQPFHNAHLEIVRRASGVSDKIIVITGSAKQPRTYKNPFTSAERATMIKQATADLDIEVCVVENIDTIYNDQAWAVRVQTIVNSLTREGDKIGIIGHKKDDSSFYLDMFPQWRFINVEQIEPLGATNIRDLYFKTDVNMNFIKAVVPETTFEFLNKFRKTADY